MAAGGGAKFCCGGSGANAGAAPGGGPIGGTGAAGTGEVAVAAASPRLRLPPVGAGDDGGPGGAVI
jgi:hypothetical protein